MVRDLIMTTVKRYLSLAVDSTPPAPVMVWDCQSSKELSQDTMEASGQTPNQTKEQPLPSGYPKLKKDSDYKILLVEDCMADVILIKEALKDANCNAHLEVVSNTTAMLEILETYKPGIILLDINLPGGKSGIEALVDLKTDKATKHIPVIMMTTSDREEDIRIAYDRHANAYVTKSTSYEHLVEVIKQIYDFWFNVAKTVK